MTKRNFRSPGLQHKNKWSDNFHDFLRCALQKEPRKRPMAQELLKVRGEGLSREEEERVWLEAGWHGRSTKKNKKSFREELGMTFLECGVQFIV